ncbi:hypothetical protein G436_0929 [Leptospira interrogans serovar Hardjo str. Norma]|uniref:Uncharacterized protein n=1 Tax=Leptospira interrogans serovar Hardjo str. Norma TaxID=1279460 RepID=A0A0M4NW65_LEPIR|nr:hypothetical protein G436_0929 [Leptospira interrogans serovar Hardjo str. Norma]
MQKRLIELLKNSIAIVNKTASIDYFIKQKQDGELIFQQF